MHDANLLKYAGIGHFDFGRSGAFSSQIPQVMHSFILMTQKTNFKLVMESLSLPMIWDRKCGEGHGEPWVNHTCENYN